MMLNGPVASSGSTIAALLKRSKRKMVPIRRAFVQQGSRGKPKPGPLAQFVRSRDGRALELYLLFLGIASSAPWDVSESAKLWARAMDLGAASDVSKIWRRLENRKLIKRNRSKRHALITALREDGSGNAYEHPFKSREPYFKLPFEYWTSPEAWHRKLSLAETALLLIALSLGDDFVLPYEKGRAWYGISADTVERGLSGLQEKGLLRNRREPKEAPLAPDGFTIQRLYRLQPPFGPRGSVRAKPASQVEALLIGGLKA